VPSWSWASLNARPTHVSNFNDEPLATLLDYNLVHIGASEFGRVTDGYIRLKGRISQATFRAADKQLERMKDDKVNELSLRGPGSSQTFLRMTLDPDVPVKTDSRAWSAQFTYHRWIAIGSRDFYLIPLCDNHSAWTGLLLQRANSEVKG
jgi:hypothetical protein